MAVNNFSRWNLIRDVTCNRRSGTLVLQLGQRYISWSFLEGNLAWITSTAPEYTMTQFLLHHQKVEKEVLERARLRVDDTISLGALLMKEGAANTAMLQEWTAQHAAWLCPFLVQTSVHLYWADRLMPVKPEFVHHSGIPLSRILLACDRNSIEVRTAFQFLEEMPDLYRVLDPDTLPPWLPGAERRLVPYLKRRDGLERMMADPELDRLTCCRTLFLLWIAGRIHPVMPVAREAVASPSWLDRARTVPPDWIIPLVVGLLLGVLLRPAPPPPAPPSTPATHHQILESPAWRPSESVSHE